MPSPTLKYTWLLLIALIADAAPVFSQDMQKCCDDNNNTFLLGNMNYALHTQCLYLPSDLSGATAGSIERIYYRYGTTGEDVGNTLTDLRISLRQTAATGFTNFLFFTDLEIVLESSSYTIPPGVTGEWFAIELDQPFDYDPSLTLVVDIVFANSTTTNFGTMSSPMNGRKIYSADVNSPTGGALVINWQDIGFDLDGSTAIASRQELRSSLMPVPVDDRLHVQFRSPLAQNATIDVIDLSGHVIAQENVFSGTGTFHLDTSALPPGAYILRSNFGDGTTENHRFVRE